MRLRDVRAQYILGTSIIKMNKYRPKLGIYSAANIKVARIEAGITKTNVKSV